MRFVLFILALLFHHFGIAQSNQKTYFHSYNAVGFLAGKSPIAFTAQTVNGIELHGWFIGAGFGIDDYKISSLPLFLDVKKFFRFKNNKVFIYADGGSHSITKESKV